MISPPLSSQASFIHKSLTLVLFHSQKLQSVCLLGTYFWPSNQRPVKRLPQGPKLSFPVQNTPQSTQIPFYKYLSFPSQSFPNSTQPRQTSRPEANHNLGCSTKSGMRAHEGTFQTEFWVREKHKSSLSPPGLIQYVLCGWVKELHCGHLALPFSRMGSQISPSANSPGSRIRRGNSLQDPFQLWKEENRKLRLKQNAPPPKLPTLGGKRR